MTEYIRWSGSTDCAIFSEHLLLSHTFHILAMVHYPNKNYLFDGDSRIEVPSIDLHPLYIQVLQFVLVSYQFL